MTPYPKPVEWRHVPSPQQRQLIALLGQLACRYLAVAPTGEENTHECNGSKTAAGKRQNSGTSP